MIYLDVFKLKAVLIVLLTIGCTNGLFAQLQPTAVPTATSSYTLEDLYKRLNDGTTGSEGTFAEPTTGPSASTMHTVNQIMEKAPLLDAANGADASMVMSGKTCWGLLSGTWGTTTGTMPNNGEISYTPGATDQTIAAGYHNGAGKVAGDADMTSENIRKDVAIFGVTGNMVGGYSLKLGGTFSTAGRWYDNNDGTITDVTTGLVWKKNNDFPKTIFCFQQVNIDVPSTFPVDILMKLYDLQNGASGLTDSSAQGDWRTPTLKEMMHISSGIEAVSYSLPQLFTNIKNDGVYWTTTNNTFYEVYCWDMSTLTTAVRNKGTVRHMAYLMPVRSGN
jgi:hypothetical protein